MWENAGKEEEEQGRRVGEEGRAGGGEMAGEAGREGGTEGRAAGGRVG